MKRIILVIIAVAAFGGLIWGYLKLREAKTGEKEHGKPAETASHVQHSTNGETTIMLDAETQKRIGLQIAPCLATNLDRQTKGYGRVLDPAPLAALVAEFAAANIAAVASVQEFERLKTLNEQNNASTRALQTAEAAARRDQLLAQTTRDKIISTWGKGVAEQKDLPAFVHSLSALENVVVRIDLPAGESLKSPPDSAHLISALAGDQPLAAEFLGSAPQVEPQTQGQGFLFLIKGNPLRLVPGAAVTGFLMLPGAPVSGVIVSRAALVRYSEKNWVYIQTASDKFVRREIAPGQPTDQGFFVSSGLTAIDRLVVSGAQLLLSEELKSQGDLAE